MRPTMWIEVKRVFESALERPPEAREAFVRELGLAASVSSEAIRLIRCRGKAPTTGRRTLDRLTVSRGPLSLTGGATATPEPVPEKPLSGRYLLGARLGAGAFGSVHRATDQVTGDAVAVKLIALPGEEAVERFREEVAVLRRARLPGIVELLDDGIEDGCAFVVMRLVVGAAFPGPGEAVPVPWAKLAPRAVAFAEALSRLHWLGILHRDLKPENVLVAADGAVTIVDLGVAQDDGLGRADSEPRIVGTPTYIAPEVFEWKPATVATDLYAFGAMLFEAVTGRPFRTYASLAELVAARNEVPPSVRDLAPHLPHFVADTIDALVDPDPARRPRSARVVAAMLRGEGADGARPRLPWLGPRGAVDAVVAALSSGRPADVAGPPGSGRSRILEEAAAELVARGFAPVWTRPGRSPYESLVPVTGRTDGPRSGAPDSRAVRTLLEMRLTLCGPVLVDDEDQLDPESRALIASLRDRGPVARCVPLEGAAADAVRTAPLAESSLRAAFAGPDRLFHFQEDGARELWRRTLGRPSEIVREIEAWIDGGIARWEQRKILIDRRGIERLEANLWSALPWAGFSASVLTRAEAEAAAVLELAGCPLALADLARIAGLTDAAARAAVAGLAVRGLVRREGDGAIKAVASVRASAGWPVARRAAVHSAVADTLPPATEARLAHLMEAARWEEAVGEAVQVATRLYVSGRTERSGLVAADALTFARRPGRVSRSVAVTLSAILFESAVSTGTPAAADQMIARSRTIGDLLAPEDASGVHALVTGFRLAVGGEPRRALAVLAGVRVPDAFQRSLHAVRVHSAGVLKDAELERSVLADAIRWARRAATGESRALARYWLGRRRYRAGAFESAAWLQARSARVGVPERTRVLALLGAASALMEAGRVADAALRAEEAHAMASSFRVPNLEGRATWLMRAVAYRQGRPLPTDTEFADALRANIAAGVAGPALLTEAAFAYRAGRADQAAALARSAAEFSAAASNAAAQALASALALACRDGVHSEVAAASAATLPESVALQVAALLTLAARRRGAPPPERPVLRPRRRRSEARLEVLSEAEASAILESAY